MLALLRDFNSSVELGLDYNTVSSLINDGSKLVKRINGQVYVDLDEIKAREEALRGRRG